MEELIEKLSKLGRLVVIKNGYVFTLFLTTPRASSIVLDVLGIVSEAINDKPNIEVMKSEDDYILIVLKP